MYADQNNLNAWTPTDKNEISAFLGIIIMMSIHILPTIDHYWSTDPFYKVTEIAEIMLCKRFKKLLEALHLNDNTKMPERNSLHFDKLYKIRPLLDLINKGCQDAAKPTSSQSIDESMIKFKGRSSMKQYLPMKPIKSGYKIWVRADSITGYVFQFYMYTGKTDKTETGLGAKVVKTLCQPLIDSNFSCHLAFDNFFSSYELLRDLRNHKIYSTATVRSDRLDLPKLIKKDSRIKKNITEGRV